MKEKDLEKQEIAKEVKSRIKGGEPKQKILEELSQKYKDKATIMKQLEITPSNAMKIEHRLLNISLVVLLGLALIVDTITLNNFQKNEYLIVNATTAINVVLDFVFLLGALLYWIEIYSWIACRAVSSLVIIVSTSMYYRDMVSVWVYVSLGLVILSFIIGLLLAVRLCPRRVPKIIEVPISEDEKIKKTIYVFPD